MLLHYHVASKTTDDRPITGSVVIESVPVSGDSVLTFHVRSFAFFAENESFLMADGDRASLVVTHHEGSVLWTAGHATFGAWDNDATGIQFAFPDGELYPNDLGLSMHLPARIRICKDGMLGGPFQPGEWVVLAWDGVVELVTV